MTIAQHFGLHPLEPRRLFSTIYVDSTAPGPHDGTSWAMAYLRLTAALNNASSGDEIHVAGGVYTPTNGTNRSATFQLLNGVSILGGYAGYGANNPDFRNVVVNPTVLSGDIGTPGDNGTFQQTLFEGDSDNSYHVVTGSGTNAMAILDGFTITHGIANAPGPTIDGSGGGMLNDGGTPTVRNCTFVLNYAQNEGGGLANLGSSASASFIACTFEHNWCIFTGGAANVKEASPSFMRCTFRLNFSSSYGSGIYEDHSSATYNDCQFLENHPSNFGGAMMLVGSSPVLTDCLFVGNNCFNGGAGIDVESDSSVVLESCTFTENGDPEGAATNHPNPELHVVSASLTVHNCILWASYPQSTEIEHTGTGTITVRYSDIQGGWSGTGNISTNPRFIRAAGPGPDGFWLNADDDLGNQRLKSNSPCIDVGNNNFVDPADTLDLSAAARLVNTIVDMGAYERQPAFTAGTPQFGYVPNPVIIIAFNKSIDPSTLQVNDLVLDRGPASAPLNTAFFTELSYDAKSFTATWTFIHPLPDDNYNAILPADAVTDPYGYPMEGEAVGSFFFLNGDANHDRHVDVADLGILASNWQQSPRTFALGDFDINGTVNVNDLGILASHWQQQLAPPSAPAVAASRRTSSRVVEQVFAS